MFITEIIVYLVLFQGQVIHAGRMAGPVAINSESEACSVHKAASEASTVFRLTVYPEVCVSNHCDVIGCAVNHLPKCTRKPPKMEAVSCSERG